MTSDDTDAIDSIDASSEPEVAADPPTRGRSIPRALAARLRGHSRIVGGLVLIAVVALVGAAYVVGGPASGAGDQSNTDSLQARLGVNPGVIAMPAATAAPVAAPFAASGGDTGGLGVDSSTAQSKSVSAPDTANGQSSVLAAVESTQIVRTGTMTLEVGNLDNATGQAQSTVAAMGGYVDSSNRVGTDADAVASITFRLPVARWDEALAALHKIGSKVLSEQTSSNDVTSQVVDLDARIDNLQKTEAALQAIMARATVIADVIAVETQLSDTQGQIEELTAARDNIKNQAAMSTLTVTFQLPAKTVTTKATQDWTLSAQIDEAGAALVRISQGLATIVVWIFIVVLPLGIGLVLVLGFVTLIRRILGRARRRNPAVAA